MTLAPDEIICSLLNKFFSSYVIIRGYQNGVKYPDAYMVVQSTNPKALGAPEYKYDPINQVRQITQLVGSDIQIDIYGKSAPIDITKLQTLLWSDAATEYLQERFNAGILQINPAQNLTDTFDSENYLPRHVITFTVAHPSQIEYNQDSSNQASGFNLHNVDVDFKSKE